MLLFIYMMTWQHRVKQMQKNYLSFVLKFELILIFTYKVIYENVNHLTSAEPQDL